MIRVLVADDHPLVRRGVGQILSETRDIRLAAEASDGAETLELVQKGRYDVVLLDISMPGRDGLDALRDLRRLAPDLPVLVLSTYPEDQYALRVLRDGAAGYLTKDRAPEELVSAIRQVHQGRRYITPAVAERLAERLSHPESASPHERLSDRELQVLRLIASGRTVSGIAEELQRGARRLRGSGRPGLLTPPGVGPTPTGDLYSIRYPRSQRRGSICAHEAACESRPAFGWFAGNAAEAGTGGVKGRTHPCYRRRADAARGDQRHHDGHGLRSGHIG